MAKNRIVETIKNMPADEFLSLLSACRTAEFSRIASLGLDFSKDSDLKAVRDILAPFGLSSDDNTELYNTVRYIAARSVSLPRVDCAQ